MTLSELSSALAARGLISQEQQTALIPDPPSTSSPWYVQVMMGACAWFAGIVLLAFVVIGMEGVLFRGHESWGVLMVMGLMACGAAAALYASLGENSAFGSQFALAMSIAGQTAIAISLGGMGRSPRPAIWGMLLLELVLTFLMQNRLHRVLTSGGAVIAWALAMHEFLFGELPGISFWGTRNAEVYRLSLMSVVLWMVVWAPVAYGGWWLVRHEAQWMAKGREVVMRPVTYGVIAALSIAPIATHPATFWMAMGLGSTRDITDGSSSATALWPMLAMFLSLLALALAFALRHRALMGLAILFGLLEVSSFYYVLGATLLLKSIIMVVLGAALLVVARWLATEART